MPKDRSIYKVDSNDSRRVIIYLPGIVYASQYVISPHSQGSIGVRNSCIDPEYSVLMLSILSFLHGGSILMG